MKSVQDLKKKLREIDHKGYKQYKELKGCYKLDEFCLSIDHVQGDPFATPSRVRVIVDNQSNFPTECLQTKERKIAVEDAILRQIHRCLESGKKESRTRQAGEAARWNGRNGYATHGSGKSGLITICPVGQEVLERIAVLLSPEQIEVRFEIGFPAYGRTIAAGELEKILFERLPQVVSDALIYKNQDAESIKAVMELADDQSAIRQQLKERNLVAFIANGAVLPRESGISQRPMKGAQPFISPKSMEVELELPHRKIVQGMGIPKGITLIAGGGYHGKSTLLKGIERGVYNHIAGDGREYVITDETAVKLRAEEGRSVREEDISMFINHLPSKVDTTRFSTENASGSTSQAANTIEAMVAGSQLFLIDEDTSATNFMVRDRLMAQLVPEESEPITPFIQCIQSVRDDLGISTILVVGSSGEYLSVADHVLQMDCYTTRDVTEKAKELVHLYEGKHVVTGKGLQRKISRRTIEKVKMHGWDTISLDKTQIDLRYLDQIADAGQTTAMAYMMQFVLEKYADGRKTPDQIIEEIYEKINKDGFLSVIPSYYGTDAPVMPRKAEMLFCLLRYRRL